MDAKEESQDVFVRFVSKLPFGSTLPENPVAVPGKLSRYGLSEIVNHLLQQDSPTPFDFLLFGEYLRVDLATYLSKRGLSHVRLL